MTAPEPLPRELTTARLVLLPYTAGDLPAFLDLALDTHVTRLVGDGAPWTRDRATERFTVGLATHNAGRGLWLALCDRRDGSHVGVVAATVGEDGGDEQVEVGIWVSPARWSTGIGREALLAAIP